MARLIFSENFRRHLSQMPEHAEADTVIAALRKAMTPTDLSYVVDERGSLRQHINIFIDGETVIDRQGLTDPVGPDSEVCVMQALSGG